MIHDEIIPILDFGSQYAQLIARRVREQGVYSLLVRPDIALDELKKLNPRGLILSGGPSSVYEPNAPKCDPHIFDLNVPILGICYGMQLGAHILGGQVQSAKAREYGSAKLQVTGDDPFVKNLPAQMTVWMSHGDQIFELPPEFVPLAATPTCPYAAARHKSRPFYGVQFHPEVTHTPRGEQLFQNFLYDICRLLRHLEDGRFRRRCHRPDPPAGRRCQSDLRPFRRRGFLRRRRAAAQGDRRSSSPASSSITACCARTSASSSNPPSATISRSTCTSSMRPGEFLSALAGVTDPQQKRKIIGKAFIDAFRHEAKSIQNARFLAQGTLYPDVIESGHGYAGTAANIKLHHNVGGLPAELGFELVEPLRDLFKDEVRAVGEVLGLPEKIVWRHPFPGPGLAVRIIGEVTPERLEVLREADEILLEEIDAANLYRKTSQVFAVLLPVGTVGVMGDERSYENVIAIRAVESRIS